MFRVSPPDLCQCTGQSSVANSFQSCSPMAMLVSACRVEPVSFRQCASLHLLREELSFQVTPNNMQQAQLWALQGEDDAILENATHCTSAPCGCAQCIRAVMPFKPPSQTRCDANRELLCRYYDSWRCMGQIHKAKGHVTRLGFHERLQQACLPSAKTIDAVI